MKHKVKVDFIEIAKEIQAEGKSEEAWAEIESSDMFQKGDYVGGFDATEMEFTFSVYEDGKEYWFQLSLSSLHDVASGKLALIEIRPSE